MSFVGEVTAACGERVELAFDMDRSSAGGNSYGFAPATGNLMYCMPQVGTKAALYLGSGNEAQGLVSGCIRTNGALCEGTGSPEKKGFCSEHGKGMSLYPQSMGMDGGEAGKLTMEDGNGTLLESSGSLLLLAKEGIRLESMTGIAVQGVSDIMALYGAGTSSLCVNGSVDMMGALTGLGGSTYINYAPYADAPEEGEFDWVGLATNLIMGLAVGAACIAMSFLLPGIGTIAAGALMGAGIGAVSASVAGAVGDYSSGNVRSTEEAMRDVAVSMVSGALTGAITGGLGAKLASAFPKAAKVVEKIPLADWVKVGLFNTGDGILGRFVYAMADGNLSVEEKFAYAFSPEHMGMDFLGGAAMYGMSKVLPKVREKLPWNKILNESGSNFGFTADEINNLKNTVISEGQMLKDIGLTNDQLGPAIAGAYDRTTGKIYTAINDYDGKVPSELAPIIRERIENMPPEVLDSYIKTKGAGSHAEIYAINKLLLDNPNAQVGDIAIYVNRTLGTSKPIIEIPFETCPHCRYILEGFNIISNN